MKIWHEDTFRFLTDVEHELGEINNKNKMSIWRAMLIEKRKNNMMSDIERSSNRKDI